MHLLCFNKLYRQLPIPPYPQLPHLNTLRIPVVDFLLFLVSKILSKMKVKGYKVSTYIAGGSGNAGTGALPVVSTALTPLGNVACGRRRRGLGRRSINWGCGSSDRVGRCDDRSGGFNGWLRLGFGIGGASGEGSGEGSLFNIDAREVPILSSSVAGALLGESENAQVPIRRVGASAGRERTSSLYQGVASGGVPQGNLVA